MSPDEARTCAQVLLGRQPTETELLEMQKVTVAELRSRVISSRQFAQQVLLNYFSADPKRQIEENSNRFKSFLTEVGQPEIDRVRAVIDALPRLQEGSGHDYVAFHAKRMEEMLLFLLRRNQHTPISSILDVGLSPFIKTYKQVLPGVTVTLTDIWEHPSEKLRALDIDSFIRNDLNKTAVSRQHGGTHDGSYDVIIFTEVIEHLLVDPVEAFTDFVSMLNPGGFLFVSTPNYLAYGALLKFIDKTNPQPRYSRRVGNDDTHYHLREYSIKELLEAANQSGGQTIFYALSDCWDRDHMGDAQSSRLPASLRSNLIIVIGKPLASNA